MFKGDNMVYKMKAVDDKRIGSIILFGIVSLIVLRISFTIKDWAIWESLMLEFGYWRVRLILDNTIYITIVGFILATIMVAKLRTYIKMTLKFKELEGSALRLSSEGINIGYDGVYINVENIVSLRLMKSKRGKYHIELIYSEGNQKTKILDDIYEESLPSIYETLRTEYPNARFLADDTIKKEFARTTISTK